MSYEDIVSNTESPTLVLAGPGAGKTYLLADRVKRLLEGGTDKSSVRVLAFGKDAAQEMFSRLVDSRGFALSPDALPRITTIHSLGFEIVAERARHFDLRKTGLKVQEDDGIKRLLFRDAALNMGLPTATGGEARHCKEAGDCIEDAAKPKCRVCRKYWEIMAKCNRVDFDDQILFACRALEADLSLLTKYRAQCRHLLVDEYQDINAAQFRLLKLLAEDSVDGLFVVGDDAQSIYGFRGASPKYILEFEHNYPTAKCPPLAHSRRCHESTMSDAVRVLSRYYSEWTGPFALKYHREPGDAPVLWQLPSGIAEAKMVARVARRFLSQDKTVLILAPKKDFFPVLSQRLREAQVPHDGPVNLLSASSKSRLAAAATLLRWVKNPTDNFLARVAIEECINRGVAKVAGAAKDGRCKPETIEFRETIETEIGRLWEAVDRRTDLLAVLRAAGDKSAILKKVLSVLDSLREVFRDDSKNSAESARVLAREAGIWPSPDAMALDLMGVVTMLNATQPTGPRHAQLMTMRKAKGLEADVVVMVGLEDDIMPGENCDDIAEAARLFYVSMTRAKQKLFLFHSFTRPRNISYGDDRTHKKRSRFLDAIGRQSKYIDRS